MSFTPQLSKPDFTVIFQSVHQYRSDNHIFEQSISIREGSEQYRFYDGPPFITGLPHYGHLASSVAKDVIPRYQTMKGKQVDRVRGRDCHGIPIEQKVQKKLGLESNLDIEKVGIETFIQGCYDYTRSTSEEWKRYIDQFGRWVDFDHSYKTMDNDYMESVRWVFKTLRDKGLIYKGKRVSLYSTKLETPISNFEVAMDDTYEEVNDPAITVMFELQPPLTPRSGEELTPFSNISNNGEKIYILAWTTTPWTIPLNIALAVNKDINYVSVSYNDDAIYIVAKNRLELVFASKEYTIIEEFLGEKLLGLSYTPPFDYLYGKTDNDKDHKIYHADFVTDTDGTGIAHEAPEFGEVDFQLAKKEGLTITEAMDSSGHYTSILGDLTGMFYRDANPIVIERLHTMGKLFKKESITHRVAFCPRSGTPLVYKAQDSRFIDLNSPQALFGGKSLKEKCIEKNEDINRYPAHNKYGRFLKSLESAPDRCISRTRYRGTPMPIYKSLNGKDMMVIGSREELFELSKNGSKNIEKREKDGKMIYRNTTRNAELDLHRPYIDDVRFEKDGVRYERVNEVLDCRVESASMPYAQVHYPFENKEKFEKSFPADYIVEYTGQIRAWFYVMHVLGVALFDKPAFTNVICHGVIAGNDGRKMSKSFGNYPNPKPTFQQYGGDAIRMSILTTPLFNGGDMNFSEDLILEALKQNILPLWNAFSFFVTYANIDGWQARSYKLEATSDKAGNLKLETGSQNRLDTWILTELARVTEIVDQDLMNYDLTHASRQIADFLENLTNRYIRRSRRRFWKAESDEDKNHAYETLYTVLTQFCLIAAPFMPFVTEYIWRTLTGEEKENSVHLQKFPTISSKLEASSSKLSADMGYAQQIVRIGLAARSKKNIRVRQPLSSLTLGVSLDQYYLDIIADELNIKQVICDVAINDRVMKICKPDGKVIGSLFAEATKEIFALAKSGEFIANPDGSVTVGAYILPPGSYEISYIKKDQSDDIDVEQGITMLIDRTITPELEREGYARDLIRAIQDARKEADYDIADRIRLELTGSIAEDIINHHGQYIQEETLSTISYGLAEYDIQKSVELGSHTIVFSLQKSI